MKTPKRAFPAEGVDVQRRKISVAAAMALRGGATVTLTSCSSGGSPAGPTPPTAAPSPAAWSCPADAVCGQDEVVAIRKRERVQKGSSLNLNHQREVTFN